MYKVMHILHSIDCYSMVNSTSITHIVNKMKGIAKMTYGEFFGFWTCVMYLLKKNLFLLFPWHSFFCIA